MILFELIRTENHPIYQALEVENGSRQYDLIKSIVAASIRIGRPFLSQNIIKALDYHAICCLHTHAGEYRPCPVGVGDYRPPEHYRVPALMDDFINDVNRNWENEDPIYLSAYVLWKLNWIHPFINGNGRTARAACYYVLCVSAGGWLPGNTIVPETIRREKNREEYVHALRAADEAAQRGETDVTLVYELLKRLVEEQLEEVGAMPEQI